MQAPSAGELRHYCTIYRWQDVPGAGASVDQEFTRPIAAYAKIEPVGAQIYHGTKQTETAVTHRFYFRKLFGITADHIIECDDIRYRIKRVSDLAHLHAFTIIEAEELGEV